MHLTEGRKSTIERRLREQSLPVDQTDSVWGGIAAEPGKCAACEEGIAAGNTFLETNARSGGVNHYHPTCLSYIGVLLRARLAN